MRRHGEAGQQRRHQHRDAHEMHEMRMRCACARRVCRTVSSSGALGPYISRSAVTTASERPGMGRPERSSTYNDTRR